MSKMVEKLQRLWPQKGAPMGFGVAKAPMAAPSFVLIAGLAKSQLSLLETGCPALDAVLLLDEPGGPIGAAVSEVAQQLTPLPVGGKLHAPYQPDALREAGYDFVLFDAETAPASLLELEEVGKFLQVEESMSDGLIRAVARLPIDALVVDLRHSDGILVRQLLFCQRCADLAGKPLAVITSSRLTKADLVCLRDVGVRGLIVTVAEGAPAPDWTSLRELATGLPPMGRKGRRPVDVLLPLGQTSRPTEEAEVEEEEEED